MNAAMPEAEEDRDERVRKDVIKLPRADQCLPEREARDRTLPRETRPPAGSSVRAAEALSPGRAAGDGQRRQGA
jgi:hypothetical protein